MVRDRSRIRVVVFRRINSEEGEVRARDTWPESENVDLIRYDKDDSRNEANPLTTSPHPHAYPGRQRMGECLLQVASVRGKECVWSGYQRCISMGNSCTGLVIYGHMPLGYLDGRNKGSQTNGLVTGRDAALLHDPRGLALRKSANTENGEAIPLFHKPVSCLNRGTKGSGT